MPPLGPDYGPFNALVKYAGQLVAAATALMYAWTPKKTPKSWEPREDDLPAWLRWAALLLVGVGLVVLALAFQGSTAQRLVPWLLVGVTGFAIFVVIYLVATFWLTYAGLAAKKGKPLKIRIVGGFGLCERARGLRAEGHQMERILAMNAYDPNGVWTPRGLLVARVLISTLFVGFLVTGSLILAMAVMAAVAPSAT